MKSFSRDSCRKIRRASSGRKQNFFNEAAYDGLFAILADTDVPFPVQKIIGQSEGKKGFAPAANVLPGAKWFKLNSSRITLDHNGFARISTSEI
jgi:hypothetical protein